MIIPETESDVEFIQYMRHAVRGRLTLGENIQGIVADVPDTGSADVEFTVVHGLGKTPRHYLYNVSKAGIVYDSRRSEWTDQEMYLKCSVSNAQITLTVL